MVEGTPGERDGDPALPASGYERLREAVLSGRPDGWRLGHGVLAARGMVAWLAACRDLAPSPQAAASLGAVPSAASSLPDADEVVAVLTQMALAHAA